MGGGRNPRSHTALERKTAKPSNSFDGRHYMLSDTLSQKWP
jgi:hypothetical protein